MLPLTNSCLVLGGSNGKGQQQLQHRRDWRREHMSRSEKEPQPGLKPIFLLYLASFCSQSLSFGEKAVGSLPITLYAKFAAHLAEESVKESSTILTVSDAVSSQEITLQVQKSFRSFMIATGCNLLWRNLLAGRLPSSRFRLLRIGVPAHPLQPILDLFNDGVNGEDWNLAECSNQYWQGSSYCLNQFSIATTTTASETEADDRSFFSSWFL